MEAVELASCIALLFFTQYGFEFDRTNEQIAHLASPFHPAILQIVKITINGAHAKGKWVGLCGEMAGDPLASEVLLGLGLDKFSMTASSISQIKEILRLLDQKECQKNCRSLSVFTQYIGGEELPGN